MIKIGDTVLESTSKRSFVPAAEGMRNAVCVDAEYLGWFEDDYDDKPKKLQKVKLVFETDDLMPEGSEDFHGNDISGRPKTIGKKYTLSQHPKATLSIHLEAWRGRPWSAEELDPEIGFNTEELIGSPCQLLIIHKQIADSNTGAPKTIGMIDRVLKPGDKKMKPSGHYVRIKDREGYEIPSTKKPK
jgi:hypothetical protein|tara:strand:+ start:288 stop:848 length:561 start_codon:yes stop_codon:yes gene_type:complete